MNLTKTLLFVVLSFCGFSQEDPLREWRDAHPNVLLIEETDATQALLDRLDATSSEYIIYSGQLTMDDIQLIEAANSNEHLKTNNLSSEDADFIKAWRMENSGVKIVKRSFYDKVTQAKKDRYQELNALILQGEQLTREDIENYDSGWSNTHAHDK